MCKCPTFFAVVTGHITFRFIAIDFDSLVGCSSGVTYGGHPKLIVEMLNGAHLTHTFRDVAALQGYLVSIGVSEVSFRQSTVWEGQGRTFNKKKVEELSEKDFEWLCGSMPYGVCTLVIESVFV
jgi:hypothetical protein